MDMRRWGALSSGLAMAGLAVAAPAVAGLATGATAAGAPAPASYDTGPSSPGCEQPGPYDLPQGDEPVELDPADFSARIDHPFWPMRPGTVWHYVERSGGTVEKVTVTVTDRTRLVAGIRARVVHDVARVDGQVTEATFDWYSQDSGGSIWYLGEDTAEYEDGVVVSTAGSWEHGTDGGQAGVILPAAPRPGCSYREEFLPDEAQDEAMILSRSETLETPTGIHRHVVHTANTTPLEPTLLENKFYARGVGPVLEVTLSPHWSRAELVRVDRP
jgi:hypothetical protein